MPKHFARTSTGAFCLVLIALVAACGSSPGPTAGTPAPASSAATSPGVGTSPSATTTPNAAPTPTAAPAGFRATSVTFVSSRRAFVLGTAPDAGALVLRSVDRGGSWVAVAAPGAPLARAGASGGHGVWGIRFASASQGFVFGHGLWETTDAGRSWIHDAAPSGSILSLATIDGQVLALVAKGGSAQAATLFRRPLPGGAWTSVAAVSTPDRADPTDLISTQAGTAAVLDGRNVLVTTNGGLTLATRTTAVVPQPYTPDSVAVTSAGTLALLYVGQGFTGHTQKLVCTSPDAGLRWVKAGVPSNEGDPVALAGGSPGSLLLATASGASWIDRSTDAGHSWATVITYGDGGQGWADLGFTTPSNVVVVHGPADANGNPDGRPGRLLLSSDAGATWTVVGF